MKVVSFSHNTFLFFFFFNDTATTEIYTFPTRRSSDLLVPLDLNGQIDAHPLGAAAEIPGRHEGLDLQGRVRRQRAKVDADPARVAADHFRRHLELTRIAGQRHPELHRVTDGNVGIHAKLHTGEADVDDLARDEPAVGRLHDGGPRHRHARISPALASGGRLRALALRPGFRRGTHSQYPDRLHPVCQDPGALLDRLEGDA